ncbi:MAG TPA: SGNH/GDSL hydrolase family protein [Cyclobacteriaceae bacterium]|nr:SGNH/GDSL hydrolase family protein [Cyclobacteriaceae bacterium]
MKIKFFCHIVFVSTILFVSCRPEVIFISPADPGIQYTGRIDFSDPANPVFMYSGVSIRAAFTGTSASIILKNDSSFNHFNVSLDTIEFVLKTRREDTLYRLAENLPNTSHRLEITRITEWHGGNTVFGGLKIDGRGLVPVYGKKHRIEFIGNSITCGYGTEGKSREEHFTYETQNCLHTYAANTAKKLGADFMLVCRSGIGMYQSYGGDTSFAMPLLYEEIISGSPVKWNFENFLPDVVVIELGANDLSSKVDSARFARAYLGFLKKLRSYYPSAKIVCISGPGSIGDEAGNTKWANLVSSAATAGSETLNNLYYYPMEAVEHNGSDWHPSAAEHEILSVNLTEYLRSLMNWQ